MLIVINGWGECTGEPGDCPDPCCLGACPGDGNNDGEVDVDDLLAVINGWTAGCEGIAAGQMPETVQDCWDLYSSDLENLEKCLLSLELRQ